MHNPTLRTPMEIGWKREKVKNLGKSAIFTGLFFNSPTVAHHADGFHEYPRR